MDQLLPESPADVPQARPIQHSYSSPETFLFLFKDLIATSRSVSEAPAVSLLTQSRIEVTELRGQHAAIHKPAEGPGPVLLSLSDAHIVCRNLGNPVVLNTPLKALP